MDTKYIIVHDTLCGPSYEYTTDEHGNEAINKYDSYEEAEKSLIEDLKYMNESKDLEGEYSLDDFWIEAYNGQRESGR